MPTTTQIAEAFKDSGTQATFECSASKRTELEPQTTRKPYAFNLGLDFGTAFTKCMLRDTRQERARPIAFHVGEEKTYLLPSEVFLEDDTLSTPLDSNCAGKALGCLKMALYASVGALRGDAWLHAVARHWPADDETKLHKKIEALVIYFLAAVIRHSRDAVVAQLPDFGRHKDDTFSVNMSVPIAHLQESGVKQAFECCLNRAWRVASEHQAGPISLEDCLTMLRTLRQGADGHLCAVYPEVSANVQAYIRSRSGFEGLFMFVDVGAGTVDASTFIYWPRSTSQTLNYFSADVVPLGCSQIELRSSGEVATRLLEVFRCCKEGGRHEKQVVIEIDREVQRVSQGLRGELDDALARCAGLAHQKLVQEGQRHGGTKQWRSLSVLTGGGGSASNIYHEAAVNSFRTWSMQPEIRPLPMPVDVDWPSDVSDHGVLFRRMTVAYGLSFDFTSLDQHRLPDEIEKVLPVDEPSRERYAAPSKDEV